MDCATLARIGLRFALSIGAASLVVGCQKKDPPVLPDPLRGVIFEQPNRGYDLMMQAAAAVEADADVLIKTVDWTPGKRAAAIARSNRALGILRGGLQAGARVAHIPQPPGEPMTAVRGWRFLGKALFFRIQASINRNDFSSAASDFATVCRFGLTLLSGDTSLATLGMAIIQEPRDLLWPKLQQMDASTLSALGREISSRLANASTERATLEQERKTMLVGISWLIERYKKKEFSAIDQTLGRPVERATRYLKELAEEDPWKVPSFFEGLIREGEDESNYQKEQAALPPFKRSLSPPEPKGERPWRRYSTALCRSGRYFLEMRAKFETEMRLFALDCLLLSHFKKAKVVPRTLADFPSWLGTDPFSGRGFIYYPQGADYKLYSVGPDAKDDGGTETDIRPIR